MVLFNCVIEIKQVVTMDKSYLNDNGLGIPKVVYIVGTHYTLYTC